MSHFAPLQYLPALPLAALGAGPELTVRVLSALSAVAVSGSVLLGILTLHRLRPRLMPLVVVILLASPLIWYAVASFSEALQMVVLCGLASAVLLRARPWVLFVVAALAGLTKETVLPFLLIVVAAAILARRPCFVRADWRRLAAPLLGGIALAVILTAVFNWARFGSFTNTFNLGADLRTPGWHLRSEFFLALFVSPNGGLTVVWPLIALMFAGAVAALLRAPRGPASQALAVVASLAVVLFSAAGLSLWFAPFGWIAWGPRLLLPLLPALVIIVAVAVNGRFSDWVRAPAGLGVIAVLGVWGLVVNIGAAARSQALLGEFFAPVGPCQDAVIQTNPTTYYACMQDLMWGSHSLVVDAARAAFAPSVIAATGLGLTAVVLWVARLGMGSNAR